MEIGSLQNKIAALADPLPLRYILGQPSSTLSITNLLLKGDNLVVDLSDIGDEPAALICVRLPTRSHGGRRRLGPRRPHCHIYSATRFRALDDLL
jgi:hypothetical protein